MRGARRRPARVPERHERKGGVKEFDGPHLLPASPGWEKVADYALDWALERAPLASLRA